MSRIDAIKKERESGKSQGIWFIDREKIEELGLKVFKMPEGNSFLAVIPPKDPNVYYAKKLFVHYNIGVNNSAFLCNNLMLKKRCPICDERSRLDKEEAEQDLINELKPQIKFLYFMIDIKNQDTILEGLRYFVMTSTLDDEIGKMSKDPRTGEYIDVSNINEGKNVIINRVGKTKTNTKYKVIKLEDRDPAIAEVIATCVEVAPEFDDILLYHDYDTIKREFFGPEIEGQPAAQPPADKASEPATSTQNTQQEQTPAEQTKKEEPAKKSTGTVPLSERLKAKLATVKSETK